MDDINTSTVNEVATPTDEAQVLRTEEPDIERSNQSQHGESGAEKSVDKESERRIEIRFRPPTYSRYGHTISFDRVAKDSLASSSQRHLSAALTRADRAHLRVPQGLPAGACQLHVRLLHFVSRRTPRA